MANVLILENPGVSTSKERQWSRRAAEPETQKEACVTDNGRTILHILRHHRRRKQIVVSIISPKKSHKGGGS